MSANAFTSLLIDLLAKVIPAADQTAGRVIATELLQSMQPADSREAAMAVQAIAASFAALDGFARAARPGISDETAIRLRGSALTAARFAVRLLQPRPSQRPAAQQPRAAALVLPALNELVTRAGRRATWQGETALSPVAPTVPAPA